MKLEKRVHLRRLLVFAVVFSLEVHGLSPLRGDDGVKPLRRAAR